jgi:hypothetical protein
VLESEVRLRPVLRDAGVYEVQQAGIRGHVGQVVPHVVQPEEGQRFVVRSLVRGSDTDTSVVPLNAAAHESCPLERSMPSEIGDARREVCAMIPGLSGQCAPLEFRDERLDFARTLKDPDGVWTIGGHGSCSL